VGYLRGKNGNNLASALRYYDPVTRLDHELGHGHVEWLAGGRAHALDERPQHRRPRPEHVVLDQAQVRLGLEKTMQFEIWINTALKFTVLSQL
jgi:hypothetical protein